MKGLLFLRFPFLVIKELQIYLLETLENTWHGKKKSNWFTVVHPGIMGVISKTVLENNGKYGYPSEWAF